MQECLGLCREGYARVFQQVKSGRNESASKLAAFTQPALSRFPPSMRQLRSNLGFRRCRMAGILSEGNLMVRLPDVSREKDLPEDSIGFRTRAGHAMRSDIDQGLLEEQIV